VARRGQWFAADAVYVRQQAATDGWARVQTDAGTPRIQLDTNLPVQSASVVPVAARMSRLPHGDDIGYCAVTE